MRKLEGMPLATRQIKGRNFHPCLCLYECHKAEKVNLTSATGALKYLEIYLYSKPDFYQEIFNKQLAVSHFGQQTSLILKTVFAWKLSDGFPPKQG